MISNKSVKVVRCEEGSLKLNGADILDLLRKAGIDVPASAVTSNMRIYFAVPGGGDWSNTDIEIDERNPLRLEWKTEARQDAS